MKRAISPPFARQREPDRTKPQPKGGAAASDSEQRGGGLKPDATTPRFAPPLLQKEGTFEL
jgi:hypothetical protein